MAELLLWARLLVVAVAACSSSPGAPARANCNGCCYPRFFAFGDSLTDTANFIRYSAAPGPVARLPYGETFFHRPTSAGLTAASSSTSSVRRYTYIYRRRREEAPLRRRDHAILPRRPGPLVAASARLHRPSATHDHGELVVPGWRDRRQLLHPPLVPEQDARLGEAPGAPCHQVHRVIPGDSDPARRQDAVRDGHLPAGLRPAVPLPVPRQRRRRLRRRRLPPVAQWSHRPPQRSPHGQARRASPRPPGRLHRLRRQLRRGP
ncbi:hypothetical protein SEVIR_2G421601v4 [Setaria viridis]|uniref:GDSL esterase/lipase n=1 Tax=Setaria viridis TaxID=4556 RepID=A0A4U6W187_SETVI|nr:hypothetical protein SEVIR_2G421601v2 [Setaria viridis]